MNILKVFFENPSEEFNVRQIARLKKIAPATASKALKKLVKQTILTEREERMLKLYQANLDSELYKDMKLFYNIRKIKELVHDLNKFYLKPTIVLFGSARYGTDTETSDFDLLVISEKTVEFPDKKKFERKLNRPLQIFNVKNIKDLKNKHLINNIVNGITIQGKIQWI